MHCNAVSFVVQYDVLCIGTERFGGWSVTYYIPQYGMVLSILCRLQVNSIPIRTLQVTNNSWTSPIIVRIRILTTSAYTFQAYQSHSVQVLIELCCFAAGSTRHLIPALYVNTLIFQESFLPCTRVRADLKLAYAPCRHCFDMCFFGGSPWEKF